MSCDLTQKLNYMIRQTFHSKYLLTLDFMYIPRCMISRIIKINPSQFVQLCCWFKYAAIISVIPIALYDPYAHLAKCLQKYTGNTLWRSTNVVLEDCSHAGSRTLGTKWTRAKRNNKVQALCSGEKSLSDFSFVSFPHCAVCFFAQDRRSQDRRIKARAQKKTV